MNLFKRYNVQSILGPNVVLSNEMLEHIDLWNLMLQGKTEWNETAEPCGVIDCTIGELAKPVCEEIEVSSENKALEIPMKKLNESTHELVQNIVAVGSSVVRPIYTNGKMQFEIVRLGNYIPTSYDLDGTLTGCVITKKIQDGKKEFLLLERHSYSAYIYKNEETGIEKATHKHEVKLDLYLIVGEQLRKADLSECSQTKDLTPGYEWPDVEMPMIVEIRNRMPNKIDGSEVPCALWQGTENLIKDADEEYNRLIWEMEGGEFKVFADEDLFKRKQGSDGVKLTDTLKKLLVKTNGNGMDAERITTYAPTLRTASHIEAFNEILRRCELAWNIGKGTLSDMQTVQQTATQYTGGKKTLYSMVDSIESELEEKYRQLAYIFAYMLSLYENVEFDDEIQVTYNDTSRKDPVAMKQAAMQEVINGIMSKAEYRMMFYGEDEATANAKVPQQPASNDYGGFTLE